MTDEQEPTLGEVQRAAAEVQKSVERAHDSQAISDTLAVGMKLSLRVHMLKKAHRPGADHVVQAFCEETGLDYVALEQQIGARVYEQVQLARIEKGLESK